MKGKGRTSSFRLDIALSWWLAALAPVTVVLASTLAPRVAGAAVSRTRFQSEAKLEKVQDQQYLLTIRVLDISGAEPVILTSPRVVLLAGKSAELKSGDDERGVSIRVLVHERGEAATVIVRVLEGGREVWNLEQVVAVSGD